MTSKRRGVYMGWWQCRWWANWIRIEFRWWFWSSRCKCSWWKLWKKKTNWEIVIFTKKCSILVFLCPFMTFVHCWGTHLWSCITVLFFVDYVLLTIFCLLTIDYFLLTVVEYFTFFFLLVVTYKSND